MVVKYDEIHPVIRQLLGCHEGFRKMGFSADDLYVEPTPSTVDGQMMLHYSLKTRRGKIFRISCGYWPTADEAGLRAQWLAAIAALKSGAVSQDDLDRIWQESFICRDKIGFAAGLMAKGIVPPRGLH